MNPIKFGLSLLALSGLFISCQKEEYEVSQAEGQGIESNKVEMIQMGKQLENPYSVENMEKAYQNLKTFNPSGRVNDEEIEITATHLYIKFKPKNDEEFAILKKDSTLILFSYPLDYQILVRGDYYHDPSVPAGQPTYQYTSVEIDKKLPNGVAYEVLSELFIPDEEKDGNLSNARLASKEFIYELVDEAFRITGNLDEESTSNARIQASSWRPAGRVRVWDGRAGRWVPVVDVEVRAKRWFTVHKGTTNSLGNYSCDGTFNRQADYSIQWEKYHFSVRSGTFGQAEHSQSNITGNWNPDFGVLNTIFVNNTQQYYALIFQAARDYYYGNRFGLSSPPLNSTWHPQVKIAADISVRQNNKPSHAAMYARTGGILPSIYVRTWEGLSDRVYAVTAHELAHAAHWDMDRDAFRNLVVTWGVQNVLGLASASAVVESWANGVEWQFAQQRYRNLLAVPGYNYENDVFINRLPNDNFQEQRLVASDARPNDLVYTSIVVDMIDNENQRLTRGGGNVAYPQDRVSGYTILQVEQGLRGATSWNQWRNNMIDRHNNPTEGFINELFANWY
jgi:hypothetical protein